MKNNIEQLPNEIFDWIHSLSFDELNENQQLIVESFITKDEYDEMHHASVNIDEILHIKTNKETIKQLLISELDNKKKEISFDSSTMWKVAAILFFVASTWLAFLHNQNIFQSDVVSSIKIKHDTMLVEKLVEIHDTIFSESNGGKTITDKKNKVYVSKSNNKQKIEHRVMVEKNANEIAYIDSSIKVVSLDQLNSISNSSKRNSRKYDSIEMNFNFVSL